MGRIGGRSPIRWWLTDSKDGSVVKELDQIISGLGLSHVSGPREVVLTGVTDDSRRVAAGNLFIARRGTAKDGQRYVADAIERGAAAVISTHPGVGGEGVSWWTIDEPGAITAEVAERFYDRPSEQLKLIGVTGTNGKTTVAYMVRHLMGAAGVKCGMMTTVEIDDGVESRVAELTTPGACEISRALARMVDSGCEACVMEASSHALDQGRCDALDFDVAVFTNLTGDHLDYHGSMEAYAQAKAKLLARSKAHVVNLDDPWCERMVDVSSAHVMGFGLGDEREGTRWRAQLCGVGTDGTRARLEGFDGVGGEVTLGMLGEHNVYNLLGALGATSACGVGLEDWSEAIASLRGAPGRLERVSERDDAFTVLVDYAHTDDALRNVLRALRPVVPDGAKLRVLFGCGGDRDMTKRPRMAEAACGLADAVVVTSDNPRTEKPSAIIDAIMGGVSEADRVRVRRIEDRAEAIENIIRDAEAGDVVLLAGKGHEDYQIIGTQKIHLDDREVARGVLEGLR